MQGPTTVYGVKDTTLRQSLLEVVQILRCDLECLVHLVCNGLILDELKRNGLVFLVNADNPVDSLTVEGFADTNPHKVSLYAFNVNEERSEGIEVTDIPHGAKWKRI